MRGPITSTNSYVFMAWCFINHWVITFLTCAMQLFLQFAARVPVGCGPELVLIRWKWPSVLCASLQQHPNRRSVFTDAIDYYSAYLCSMLSWQNTNERSEKRQCPPVHIRNANCSCTTHTVTCKPPCISNSVVPVKANCFNFRPFTTSGRLTPPGISSQYCERNGQWH